MDRGDFNIFIDGVNKRDIGAGLVRTAVPTAFPGYEPEPLRIMEAVDDYITRPPFGHITSAEEQSPIEGVVEGVRSGSMDIDPQYRPEMSPSTGPWGFRGTPYSAVGHFGGIAGSSTHSPSSSISSIGGGVLGRIDSNPDRLGYSGPFATTQRIGQPHSRPSTSGTSGPPGTLHALPGMSKKVKPNYSWNELVDRENLGVRPGEGEILPRDFEMMCVYSVHHSTVIQTNSA